MAEYDATTDATRTAPPIHPEPDPIRRFREVFAQAEAAGIVEPSAMTVATVDPRGRPSARMILLKGVDERGFVWYTNLESRKAEQLKANPHVALCFFWQPLEIQIRVEGKVEPVSDEEADAYFASRPRGSQLGAWSSQQSAPLTSRAELEARVRAAEERFAGQEIPRPGFWSGFRVLPDRIEFWLGRPSRLHERDLYVRDPDSPSGWLVQQLYP